MRIFIDARPIEEPQPSGVSVYTREITQALVTEYPQHQFLLFVSGLHPLSHFLREFGKRNNVAIRNVRIPNKLLHAMFVLFRRPLIERIAGVCDCYFFPNVAFLPQLPHPCLVTVHDLTYEHLPFLFRPWMRLWHMLVNPMRLLRQADSLVAVSHATALLLADEVPSARGKIHSVLSATSRPMSVGTQDAYALYIGNIEERKNIAGMLLAWKRIAKKQKKAAQLILAGKKGFLARETKKLMHDMEQSRIISLLGYVTEQEKNALVSRAAVLLFPSLYEGYGFPVAEAISAGIPVVTSSKTSLPEVADMQTFCVDPFDVSAIEKAIETAIQNPTRHAPDSQVRSWRDVAHDMMQQMSHITTAYAHRD